MNLDDIHIFIEVVNLKSFSKAGKKVGLSAPTVTRRITRLEKSLNIQLLRRNTRQFALTQAGRVCYEACREIPTMLSKINNQLGEDILLPTGQINLCVSVYSGYIELLPKLSAFLEKYPQISINYVKSNIFPDLIDSNYDFYMRYQQISTRSLTSKKLTTHQLVACATPLYLAKRGRPKIPHELSQHNCIIHRYNLHEGKYWRFKINNKEQSVSINGNIMLNSSALVLEAVKESIGIAYLPSYFVSDDIKSGLLEPLLNEFSPTPMAVWLIYPRSIEQSYKDQLFLEHILSAYDVV